jgi:glycerol-3-phosphate acyltransferase PlsX
MKLAIDAMGGDFAPEAIIEGVKRARDEFPDLEFQLFGDEDQIRALLPVEKNVEIVATSEVIDFHDDPVKSIKQKKDSSMIRAIQAVKAGEADAVLSAGSTGAFLTAGVLLIGRLKSIDRPGLLSTLPTTNGRGFDMLDLGANAENKAEHLRDFAILGSFYAEHVRAIDQPRVGLLSNGTEASKGSPMIKEAHAQIAALSGINFIGNIESRDLLTGMADVVVADGFTGNAVLKSIEGTASALMHQISDTIKNGSLGTKIGGALVKKELSSLRGMMSTETAGGAFLAGLKAPIIKAHGNSNPQAIAATIRQIHKLLDADVIGKLTTYLEK